MRLDLYQQVDILFSVLEELLKSPFNKQFDDKVKHVLRKHGLDVVEGEIVKTQRTVSAEAKEAGYGEPEDERIRKEIIMIFKGQIPFTSEEEAKTYIAWLEKQGQKPAWTEADDEEFEIAINTLKGAGQYDSAAWLITLKQRLGG